MGTAKTINLNITIDLGVMDKLGIDLNQAAVASLIKEKMTDPDSQMVGWVPFSKDELAKYLKVSKMTVFRALKELVEKGLVERLGSTKYIRITSRYYQYTNGIPSTNLVPPVTKENTPLHPLKENNITLSPPKGGSLPRFSRLDDLTEADFEEIANRYEVPVSFVRSKFDDMMLWAEERPGNTKLKGRNWRSTLMHWVKRDAFEIRSKPRKGGVVDASNL